MTIEESANYKGLERFNAVDATGEEHMFFAFLDRVERITDAVARRRLTYERLQLRPGARIADVGCGLGTAAREIYAHVQPGGLTWGVDLSSAMVAEAGRRAVAAGMPVEFRAARAEALPFADAALDGYRAERLYQHLANPLAALAEARRCLAPGGRIVLVDQDWDAFLLDAEDIATSRDVHRAFTDSLVGGTVGRQFRRLLLQAGFAHVRVEIDAVGSDDAVGYGFIVDVLDRAARAAGLESAKVDAWSADQRKRLADGRFFMLMTHFVASATRP